MKNQTFFIIFHNGLFLQPVIENCFSKLNFKYERKRVLLDKGKTLELFENSWDDRLNFLSESEAMVYTLENNLENSCCIFSITKVLVEKINKNAKDVVCYSSEFIEKVQYQIDLFFD